MSAGSNESERIVTWIKWKWKCCHLDDMKVRVMSPGWDGSWLIFSDGTVQPNSCSFLSLFHVKLCWPMTIVSGGEGRHAMCFFLPKRKICTHPCGFYCRKPLQSPVISLHFEWDFGFDILFKLSIDSASTIKMYSWYWFGGAVQFLAFKIWTCQCW